MSVTRPFDSSRALYYKRSIVTMHLSSTVMEIYRLKDNRVTSLTFWGHVTSSVTWPFDSRGVGLKAKLKYLVSWETKSVGISPVLYSLLMQRYRCRSIICMCFDQQSRKRENRPDIGCLRNILRMVVTDQDSPAMPNEVSVEDADVTVAMLAHHNGQQYIATKKTVRHRFKHATPAVVELVGIEDDLPNKSFCEIEGRYYVQVIIRPISFAWFLMCLVKK